MELVDAFWDHLVMLKALCSLVSTPSKLWLWRGIVSYVYCMLSAEGET